MTGSSGAWTGLGTDAGADMVADCGERFWLVKSEGFFEVVVSVELSFATFVCDRRCKTGPSSPRFRHERSDLVGVGIFFVYLMDES